MNLVEDRERQGLTDAGDCLQSLVGVAIVSARLAKDRELEVSDDGVVVVDELEVGGEVRLDGDVIEGLGNALTIGLVGDPPAGRDAVVLVVGILDVGEKLPSMSKRVDA